jgi:hypothetical protein
MEGSGRHIKNRMTLYRDNDYEDAVFLDGLALDISANYTARYSPTPDIPSTLAL